MQELLAPADPLGKGKASSRDLLKDLSMQSIVSGRKNNSTQMAGQKVRDHYLEWYIERLRWFPRPVEGISVLMPIDQGPRASRIETSQ